MPQAATHPWRDAAPVTTRRLALRHVCFDDAPRILGYAGDPAVSRMLAVVPHPYTPAHASAFIGDAMASNAAGDGLVLAVARRREAGALIGVISFARRSDTVAEIGWWLGKPYWGKGFATEAVAAMVEIAFRDPTLAALSAGAFADNAASLRIQDKIGFVRTGADEKHSLARGGLSPHVATTLTREAFARR